MQSVWSWLVLPGVFSLILVGTVWCIQFGSGWHCLVLVDLFGPVWIDLFGPAWIDLFGPAWIDLFGPG